MKFIESIRLEDAKIHNLALHQRRADLTTLAHFGQSIRHDLSAALAVHQAPALGLYKIRVTYGTKIYSVEIEPYTRRQVRGLALVDAPNLDYRYKYADRSQLMALKNGLGADVEPIIVRDGLITDGLYANVCLADGELWVTPEQPLLLGVARAAALSNGQVVPAKISAADVRAGKYQKLKLINCMTLFAEAQEVPWSPMPRRA